MQPQRRASHGSEKKSAWRKMQVYQHEEGPGGPEAQAVFLEPSLVAKEPGLHTEEPRPVELSGTPRVGLEGPERRRFSASELMTRLHSSLRLGRSSTTRALASGAGTGASPEGTSHPWDSRAARARCQVERGPLRGHLGWVLLSCVRGPHAQGYSPDGPHSALAFSRQGIRKGVSKRGDEGGQCGRDGTC
ncbi:Rho guanine nucleotide exchange factor 19 [Fukomys damarensis]|uniref:Rho guanine nucleotide exchange factor 19 n=1 Tax=Fukomys damarensis TaxID=885580 RepID=A0A091E6Z2_FUKDA|nr:Rho guanine nucleotide exchange factor 19 [Fukomys damarensis]